MIVGEHQVELVEVIRPAYRIERRRGRHRRDHVVECDAECPQTLRIDVDVVLLDRAALHVDVGDTRDTGDDRPQLEGREIAKRGWRNRVRSQAVGCHRKHGRVHSSRSHLHAGGQAGQDLAQRRVDGERRACHVRAPRKRDRHVSGAAARPRAHGADAGHAAYGLLDRLGDEQHHLLGIAVAGIDVDDHPREIRDRKQRHRQRRHRHEPAGGQQRRQKEHRAPVPAEPVHKIQGFSSATAAPSSSS